MVRGGYHYLLTRVSVVLGLWCSKGPVPCPSLLAEKVNSTLGVYKPEKGCCLCAPEICHGFAYTFLATPRQKPKTKTNQTKNTHNSFVSLLFQNAPL